jgi:hypothetical protein
LRAENESAGRLAVFERLRPFLTGGPTPPLRDLAAALDTTEAAVKMTVFRLRRRYQCLPRTSWWRRFADPGYAVFGATALLLPTRKPHSTNLQFRRLTGREKLQDLNV